MIFDFDELVEQVAIFRDGGGLGQAALDDLEAAGLYLEEGDELERDELLRALGPEGIQGVRLAADAAASDALHRLEVLVQGLPDRGLVEPLIAESPKRAQALLEAAGEAMKLRERLHRLEVLAMALGRDEPLVPRDLDARLRRVVEASPVLGPDASLLRIGIHPDRLGIRWWLTPGDGQEVDEEEEARDRDQAWRGEFASWLGERLEGGRLRLTREDTERLMATRRGRELLELVGDSVEPYEAEVLSFPFDQLPDFSKMKRPSGLRMAAASGPTIQALGLMALTRVACTHAWFVPGFGVVAKGVGYDDEGQELQDPALLLVPEPRVERISTKEDGAWTRAQWSPGGLLFTGTPTITWSAGGPEEDLDTTMPEDESDQRLVRILGGIYADMLDQVVDAMDSWGVQAEGLAACVAELRRDC